MYKHKNETCTLEDRKKEIFEFDQRCENLIQKWKSEIWKKARKISKRFWAEQQLD